MDKRVEIHGTSRADMNGKRGVATDFHWYKEDESKWRYTVQLDSGEAFKIKPANVRVEGLAAPLLDRRVETFGGSSETAGNGMLGLADDFYPSKEMYQVKFDTGEVMDVPAANLRAEGTGGASGAGKAKKGKGKKGRKG